MPLLVLPGWDPPPFTAALTIEVADLNASIVPKPSKPWQDLG
jgi:hypothetical protein